uniref:Uncharacterized protein n=1 Tax=Wuchereria bancrofti TaxID=6293 RepID=A0A1I8EBN9_WUCBA
MTSSNTNVAIVLATPVISRNIGRDDACDMSHLIQSMCASSSSSYVIDQGRERISRPKPPPPIKPATLKNKIGCRNTQSLFFPQTSKADLSIADSLQRAPSDVINSSETAHEERTNHAGEVIHTSEDTTTESDPSFEVMRITDLCIEEFKKVENESHALESFARPNSGTIITNKRASFINEEIKKPKIKPPPPPIQSLIRRSQSGRDTSKIEAIRKKLNLEGVFDTNRNIAPNNVSIDESTSSNAHRFERCLESLHIPSIPSIPPPLPPMLSPHDALNEETYEEIEQLTYAEENGETGNKTGTVDELIDEVLMRESNCDKSAQGESYAYKKGNQLNDKSNRCSSNNHFGATLRESNESNVRTNEKAATMRRPKSALEFDKLLRIKSDIQLNITKKVGQIKFKVSSASQERQRCKRLSYTDRERLKNCSDDKVLAKIDFPLDEQCIYGDVWSSDDDDYICSTDQKQEQTQMQSQKSNLGEVINVGKNTPDEPYSMLSEIERELRLRFQTHNNLPDIVLESRRRSMSADPLIHDTTSITAITENDASSGWRCIQGYGGDNDGVCCQTKDDKLKPSTEGYETIISSISPSSEHNCLPSTSSDYTLREIDRSIYTARVIPDPQPLYQIYMMEQNGQLIYETKEQEVTQPSFSEKSISKMQRVASTASTDSGRGADCSTTMSQLTSNTSMRRERLVAGSHFASQRSLWCELPEVRNAGLLERLDEDMKKLQEAYFEVITSEASYLRSINILITHFMAAPEMLGSKRPSSTITNEERKQLFSNIFAVRDCSEKLLSDLENRLQESLVLSDVCDILCDHFETNFDPYIKYCSNQVYQDRTLRKLKSENPSFLSCIQRLESDRLCQGLDMRSFLMLPMQRVTRYPLLMIAILEHAQQDATNYQTAQIALYLANHIVTCCNEGARHMERTEQLLEIERRLVYKSSDLSNGSYICKDYSARRFVDIEPVEVNDPKSVTAHIPLKKPHLFICTLMHNAVGKQVELLLNADSETDRERWLSALRPPACTNPEEKIYADWDCPQAVAVHRYSPSQEDELPLERGDLINILRKMPDGWFYGERVRDCYSGWFPSSYIQQVLNDHVRAKNYRQRLRVIQAAADFRFHQRQMKIETEENARHIMERFRRLSNTKSALNDLKSNQTC